MDKSDSAMAVYEAIHDALRATDKTREPMNALVLWTELGKGLAGKLEQKGADRGLPSRLCAGYCAQAGAGEPVDLARWAYRVEPGERLDMAELAAASSRVLRSIEQRLLADQGDTNLEERQRDYFHGHGARLVPRGPRHHAIAPALRGASDAQVHAALGAWCARYLPRDTTGPADLGVRLERRAG
ncbi:MAG: hypothetical protein U0359_17525 [Byssovorax sp.]